MNDSLFVLLIATSVSTAVPLLLAALGESVIERSGVINLGVEGIMLIAALTAFWATTSSNNPWLGVLAATVVAGMVGAIYAGMTVALGCDQIVTGLALNVVAAGITSYLGRGLIGVAPSEVLHPVALPILSDISILGPIFFNQPILGYVTFLLVPLLWFFLRKTNTGLSLRAVGESPNTADAAGISVYVYRYAATMAGAAIIGLAGAHLSTSLAPAWTDNLTAGRGWIAIALVIFGRWDPIKVLLGSLLFGLVEAISFHAQALNVPVSSYLLQAAPYLLTIAALAFSAYYTNRRTGAPASLGVFWQRS